MKVMLIMLFVLVMTVPCFGRSKKSQAKIDARHAQANAASQANLNNAKADQVRTRTRGIQQNQIQRQHQRGIRNGNQYRAQKAQRGRKYTGF